MTLLPYITFNGNCEEALTFYASCFKGEITGLNRYEGSPIPVPENYKNKIMHGEMHFENNSIAACDAQPGSGVTEGTNFSLLINVVEVFVLNEVFNNLAQGGTITMPLQDTFWGARFGMITDKFGIRWMFSCDLN